MVLIEMNSDAILVEVMNNRTAHDMVRAYQALVDMFKVYGVGP